MAFFSSFVGDEIVKHYTEKEVDDLLKKPCGEDFVPTCDAYGYELENNAYISKLFTNVQRLEPRIDRWEGLLKKMKWEDFPNDSYPFILFRCRHEKTCTHDSSFPLSSFLLFVIFN